MNPRKTDLDSLEIVTRDNFKQKIQDRKVNVRSKIQKNEAKYELKESEYQKKITEKNEIASLKELDFYKIFPDVKSRDLIIEEKRKIKIDEDKLHIARRILELDLKKPLIYQPINWAKNLQAILYTGPYPLPAIGKKSNLCAGFKKDRDPCQQTRKLASKTGLNQAQLDCYCDCLAEAENDRRHAVKEQVENYLQERIDSYDKTLKEAEENDKRTREKRESKKTSEWNPTKKHLESTQSNIEILGKFVTGETKTINLFKDGIVKIKVLQPPPAHVPSSTEIKEGGEVSDEEPGMDKTEKTTKALLASTFPKTNRLLKTLLKEIRRLYNDTFPLCILSSGADKAYYIMTELAYLLATLDDQQYNDETLYDKIKTECQTGSLYPYLAKKRNEKFARGIFSPPITDTELTINKTINEIDGTAKFSKTDFILSRPFLSQRF